MVRRKGNLLKSNRVRLKKVGGGYDVTFGGVSRDFGKTKSEANMKAKRLRGFIKRKQKGVDVMFRRKKKR